MKNLENYQKLIITKKNRQISLRPPRIGDVDKLLQFINDLAQEDTYITINQKVSRKGETEYLTKRVKAIKEKNGFNLLAIYQNKIIANGGIDRQGNRQKHLGELGISIGQGFRDEGLGSELMNELINLAKSFLKLKIISLKVFGNNARAIHFYKKFGFKECGRIPGGILYKKKYIDDVIMYLNLR
jgi:RimJ/RimL family protein N-acetyltransferase